jgi:hypothetical protein
VSVVEAGNTAIWRLQMTPKYRSLCGVFADGNEAKAEERAKSIWDDARKWHAFNATEPANRTGNSR